jgi:hypothetical protein
MATDHDILAGLTSVIFTIDGQPVCRLGKDIFEASNLNEPAIFFTGLIQGVRDFSTVFETELRTVTAIGQDFLVKVILSPTYTVESTVQRDLESVKLEERLTGKKLLEQMGWTRKDRTGFAIGFEVIKIPYYTDFPDFSRNLELYTIRKLAQTFYTDFADNIRKYDLDISPQEVIKAIRKRGRGYFAPQIVDVGHPIYVRRMETTIIHNESSLEVEDLIEHSKLSPFLTGNTLGAIVSTIYTSMDALFNFASGSNREGDLIIDFGGIENIGYSLFASGVTIVEEASGNAQKALIMSVMIGAKEKYVLGGKGEVPTIIEELRTKVDSKVKARKKKKERESPLNRRRSIY